MTHCMAYSMLTLEETGNVTYKCIKGGSGLILHRGGVTSESLLLAGLDLARMERESKNAMNEMVCESIRVTLA